MIRVAVAVLAAAAFLAPAAPAAVALPWPGQLLTASPPLAPVTVTTFANRFRGRIAARSTLTVVASTNGRVRSVDVVQKLSLNAAGDYVLTIAAPVTAVSRAAGSDADPGRRRNAIVWQGFSPGRRTLAARAGLELRSAAPSLPLAVRLRGGAGSWAVEIENLTQVTVASFTARATDPVVARYVLELADFEPKAGASEAPFADVSGIAPVERRVSAAFSLRGTARFPGGRTIRLEGTVGGGRPLRLRLPLSGSGRPRVRLVAVPTRPVALLEQRPRTLDAAIDAALALGLARQYHSFLASPDVAGSSQTTYVYRVEAPVRQTAEPISEHAEKGVNAFGVALVLAVGAAALLVLWSRS
jgi:hypothetical protein